MRTQARVEACNTSSFNITKYSILFRRNPFGKYLSGRFFRTVRSLRSPSRRVDGASTRRADAPTRRDCLSA
jgi:hypothetical protein